MTSSRSHLPVLTHCHGQISDSLLPAQHMEGNFGQMLRHRSHRLAVPFPGPQPRIR
jgi:hypothetical protein